MIVNTYSVDKTKKKEQPEHHFGLLGTKPPQLNHERNVTNTKHLAEK